MAKKSHTKKQSKKKGFSSFFPKIFLSLFVGSIFFVGTLLLLPKNYPAFCANSGSCKSDLTEKIDNNAIGRFGGHTVIPPKINPQEEITHVVLGDSTKKETKHIYVNLSTQTLYAYEGTNLFLKTLVATGKWNKTPTGNFHIWEKLRSTRMSGGEGDDAYDLPNVPYVMYFYNDFGLHGAYWHDNFGHPMSHGCVNMRQVDAKTLYDWADGPQGSMLGTAVSICNQITNAGACIQDNPVQ